MNKLKKFEDAVRNLEEMAKLGQISGVHLTIDDEDLIKNTHVGQYYSLKACSIKVGRKDAFYEKNYKFKFREIQITIHLSRNLTKEEIKSYAKYETELKNLNVAQKQAEDVLLYKYGINISANTPQS